MSSARLWVTGPYGLVELIFQTAWSSSLRSMIGTVCERHVSHLVVLQSPESHRKAWSGVVSTPGTDKMALASLMLPKARSLTGSPSVVEGNLTVTFWWSKARVSSLRPWLHSLWQTDTKSTLFPVLILFKCVLLISSNTGPSCRNKWLSYQESTHNCVCRVRFPRQSKTNRSEAGFFFLLLLLLRSWGKILDIFCAVLMSGSEQA